MQIPLFGTRYHSFTRKIFISLRWAFLDPLRIVSSYLTGSQEVLTENFAREGVEKDSPSTAPSNYSLQLRLRRSLSHWPVILRADGTRTELMTIRTPRELKREWKVTQEDTRERWISIPGRETQRKRSASTHDQLDLFGDLIPRESSSAERERICLYFFVVKWANFPLWQVLLFRLLITYFLIYWAGVFSLMALY